MGFSRGKTAAWGSAAMKFSTRRAGGLDQLRLHPRFIGRPMVTVFGQLTEDQLILTEPRNSLIKRYAKLMAGGRGTGVSERTRCVNSRGGP
jgi:ATP-dependent protease Clp ATPase subunit